MLFHDKPPNLSLALINPFLYIYIYIYILYKSEIVRW